MFQKVKDSTINFVRRLVGHHDLLRIQREILNSNSFLNSISSVIHIGANHGQERELYDQFGLKVLWVEPIPEVFAQLQVNIADYRRQRAIKALVTDTDDQTYEFYLANNNGASSSILRINEHKNIWPEIEFVGTINLQGRKLTSLLDEHGIKADEFEALVLDTQGSELLALKGAESILNNFRFIKTEVANFDSYADCCTVDDIDSFLLGRGFSRFSCERFMSSRDTGAYYNITYINREKCHETLAALRR